MFTAEPDVEFAQEAGLSEVREVKTAARTDAAAAGLLFD
jgi:hypothetical protein